MRDTSFQLLVGAISRFTDVYRSNHESGELELCDGAATSAWATAPPMGSGAGGLISTIDDYFAFSRMLLNDGALAGKQIFSAAAVKLMTTDQLTPENRVGAELFFRDDSSWGLGVGVDIPRRQIYQTPGRFGWTGGFGTSGYIDPREGMIGILFTQRMMDSPDGTQVASDFWTCAYGAMPSAAS